MHGNAVGGRDLRGTESLAERVLQQELAEAPMLVLASHGEPAKEDRWQRLVLGQAFAQRIGQAGERQGVVAQGVVPEDDGGRGRVDEEERTRDMPLLAWGAYLCRKLSWSAAPHEKAARSWYDASGSTRSRGASVAALGSLILPLAEQRLRGADIVAHRLAGLPGGVHGDPERRGVAFAQHK